jgi:hypothetical protein
MLFVSFSIVKFFIFNLLAQRLLRSAHESLKLLQQASGFCSKSAQAANTWRCSIQKPDVRRCPQMTGHGAKFGRKKEDAIVALLTHRTIEEAARAVNISPKTLLRWQKDADFDAEYRKAKRAAYGQATARMHHLTGAAVSTLGKIMLDPAMPPATRVRAADSILDHSAKAIEIEDVEVRVAALEQAAEEAKGSGRK